MQNGLTFDRIVLRQTTSAGFESDNHTFSTISQPVEGIVVTATPEPMTFMGVGLAVIFGTYFKRQLKKSY